MNAIDQVSVSQCSTIHSVSGCYGMHSSMHLTYAFDACQCVQAAIHEFVHLYLAFMHCRVYHVMAVVERTSKSKRENDMHAYDTLTLHILLCFLLHCRCQRMRLVLISVLTSETSLSHSLKISRMTS
eukprot:15843-Heterococcus_DN1.PRE.2